MPSNQKTMCIYHDNCADGFASAWVVREALGEENVEFIAANYQQDPPDVTDREVLIVDFSYKSDVMEAMAHVAKRITVLDHHKTAQEDLEHLLAHGTVLGKFDMSKAGAGLTWEFMFPNKPMPLLLQHIQDRDLWVWQLEGTKEITTALFSYPFEFKLWDRLIQQVGILHEEGTVLLRKQQQDLENIIETGSYRDTIAGYEIPVVNAPMLFASDACHMMAEGELFAACYTESKNTRKYSLRSRTNGIDVSKIAKQFGGGGHKHAAGFSIPKDQVHLITGKEAQPC